MTEIVHFLMVVDAEIALTLTYSYIKLILYIKKVICCYKTLPSTLSHKPFQRKGTTGHKIPFSKTQSKKGSLA